MRYLIALSALAALAACGTKPPLPPDCEGALSPINAQVSAANTGAIHESRTNP